MSETDHRQDAEWYYAKANEGGYYDEVQIKLLRAIYNELRHGHDLQARQQAAMENLIEAMDKLSRRLGDR